MTTKYTTRSGSVYLVRAYDGVTEVYRTKLGEAHRGENRQKRLDDNIDHWEPVVSFECHGVGYRAIIEREPHGQTLITSPVVAIEAM